MAPACVSVPSSARHGTASRQFQGIPGIECAPNGRLWATWYSGGVTEGPDNFVLLVTSDDGGKTWSEPVAVVVPPGNVRAYDPTLWHDPQGRMWLFWSQSMSKDGNIHDGRAGVWGAWTKDSNSANPKFSSPVRIADGVMMNKPVVLSSGEWAMPTAVWECQGPKLEEMKHARFSNMTISSDNGRTFQLQGGADIAHRCFDEHMIVEKKDGRLWMLVRTLYGIGQSFSSDKGKTWSPGENSNLGGPNSRFFITRLSSGNLLLINHADISSENAVKLFIEGKTWRPRSHLTALISDDDGKTWKGGFLLDEREGVSYPDGVQGKDGVIRIIYDHQRYKAGEILMASFREEDVLAAKPASKDLHLKMLVNRTGGLR